MEQQLLLVLDSSQIGCLAYQPAQKCLSNVEMMVMEP
jgi:hypothetical protein